MKRAFAICAVSAFLFAACGDDDSSGFTTRPDEDSSSSVCEDCDDSSSSSSVTPQSSESETSVSSSSAKSSSSKNGDAKSSSSSAESLSSDASSISFFEDGVTGTMTDGRDGQTYKIVKIGKQIWMAENLNYAYIGVPYIYTETNTSDSSSWCYDNDPANCTKYGRLYTWSAAMDSAGTWTTNGKGCGYNKSCSPTYPVRGVCPEGWHLPTQTEWNTLFTAVGGQSTAGKMLKSTSGWNSSGNGTDAYSFSALPAGCGDVSGGFYDEGNYAYFWSSTGGGSYYYAYYVYLYYGDDNAYLSNHGYLANVFSVRCVKD